MYPFNFSIVTSIFLLLASNALLSLRGSDCSKLVGMADHCITIRWKSVFFLIMTKYISLQSVELPHSPNRWRSVCCSNWWKVCHNILLFSVELLTIFLHKKSFSLMTEFIENLKTDYCTIETQKYCHAVGLE